VCEPTGEITLFACDTSITARVESGDATLTISGANLADGNINYNANGLATGLLNMTLAVTNSIVNSTDYGGVNIYSEVAEGSNVRVTLGEDVSITSSAGFGGVWVRNQVSGDITIESGADLTVSGKDTNGISATTNAGSVHINNSGDITVEETPEPADATQRGIYADGGFGDVEPVEVSVTNSGTVNAQAAGIRTVNYNGLAKIENSGVVSSVNNQALVAWTPNGEVEILNDTTGDISSESGPAIQGASQIGDITITNRGLASGVIGINAVAGFDDGEPGSGNITLDNSGTINAEGGPGIYARTPVGNVSVTNSGSLSSDSTGMDLDTLDGTVSITNSGTISGSTGIVTNAAATTIINSGAITPIGDGAAIVMGAGDVTLELRAGSSITGLVSDNDVENGTNKLVLGGSSNASFDAGSIGADAQYRDIDQLTKTGSSAWTLTGEGSTGWTIEEGVLTGDNGAAFGVDQAYVVDGGTLDLGGNTVSIASLDVSQGSVVDTSGGMLILNQDTDEVIAGELEGGGTLRKAGTGTLALSGTGSSFGGALEVAGGTVNLTGTYDASSVNVGGLVSAALTIAEGGSLGSDTALIGMGGTTGSVTVAGEGSSWVNSSSIQIGRDVDSTGSLTISDGGVVETVQGSLYMGAGGSVTISGAGSTLNIGTLHSEPPVDWNAGDGWFSADGGSISVSDGATLAADASYIGASDDGPVTMLVDGAGTTWSNGLSLYIGGTGNGDQGTGVVTVSGGATVTSYTSAIGVDTGSTGTLTLAGEGTTYKVLAREGFAGNMRVGYSGTGNATVSDGALLAAAALIDVASQEGSNGTLVVETGGQVTGESMRIGGLETAVGSVRVDGAGSTLSIGSGRIGVGVSGEGSLTVSNGGSASSEGAVIGWEATGKGIATITGAGSEWTNDGILYVGNVGDGALNIADGGRVTSTDGYVGTVNGAKGTVNISGAGSIWDMSGLFIAGQEAGAESTITISGGGTLRAVQGTLGNLAGSHAEMTVTGAGSTWSAYDDGITDWAGYLNVGLSGSGSLSVTDGGTVEAVRIYIGNDVGSSGTVLLSGAGSSIRTEQGLYVGTQGSGELTLTDGATIEAGTIKIGYLDGATGVLNIGAAAGETATAAGTIDTAEIALGSGESRLVLNHNSSNYEIAANFTGSGALDVLAGTTLLSGDSSAFAGSISVQGGKAILAGATSATSTAVGTEGTLQIGNGGTGGSLDGDISNNGALVFDRSDAWDYAGKITGLGEIVHAGSGTTNLTGDLSGNHLIIANGTVNMTGNDVSLFGTGAGIVVDAGSAQLNATDVAARANNTVYLVREGGSLALDGGSVDVGGSAQSAGLHVELGSATVSGTAFTAAHANTYGVVVDAGGSLTVSDSTITTTGDSAFAALARDGGTLGISGSVLETAGTEAYAVHANNGGTITLANSTVRTSGLVADALVSDGAGSQISATNTTIETTGIQTAAVVARNGGAIDLTGGSVSATVNADNPAAVWALLAKDGGSISATDVDLSLTMLDSSPYVTGVAYAMEEGSSITINGGTATATGRRANGIFAYNSGSVTAEGLTISTSGEQARGVYANADSNAAGSVTLRDVTISAVGKTSHGLFAKRDGGSSGNQIATISAENIDLTVDGEQANGIYAAVGGAIDVSGGSVSTSGFQGHALHAQQLDGGMSGGGTLTASNLTISTSGASATGALAEAGGTISLTNSAITTSGEGSYGLYAMDGGQLALTASTVETAAIGAGIANSGSVTMTGGRIESGGASLEASTSNGSLASFSFTGTQLTSNNGTLLAVTHQLDGDGSGAASLALLGNSSAKGAITGIGEGRLDILVRDSSLEGGILNASKLTLDNAAWTVTELQGLGELEIANGGTTISTTATITHDGKLTGSGTFDKTGTGRFVLAGDGSSFAGTANIDAGSVLLTGSLGGNVVINAQGTLLVGDGTTDGDLTASTLNNGTLVFNQTGDYDYTGALSGNGGLVKQGEGTLLLSGTSGTFAGSISVDAGKAILGGSTSAMQTTIGADSTLQIGNGGSSGSLDSDISNNGALVFDRSDALHHNRVISGSGNLTIASGVITLSGMNTFTGATTIDNGATLALLNQGRVNQSSLLTVHGTFDATAGAAPRIKDIAGDGTVLLGNGGLQIDSASHMFSGKITGSGGLVVNGGTLTLTGENDFANGLGISDGATVRIGNGGTTGSITASVLNYGTLLFDRADEWDYAGAITGRGEIVHAGSGTTNLTGGLSGNHLIVGNGTVNMTGGLVALFGTGAGIVVDAQNARLNVTNVGARAANTVYLVREGGSLALSGGSVRVGSSAQSAGLHVEQGSASVNGTTFTAAHANTYGVVADAGSALTVSDSTISTTGDSAFAALARDGGTISLTNSAITTSGEGSYGLYAMDGGQLALTASTVETAAIGAGIANSGSVTMTGGRIESGGASLEASTSNGSLASFSFTGTQLTSNNGTLLAVTHQLDGDGSGAASLALLGNSSAKGAITGIGEGRLDILVRDSSLEGGILNASKLTLDNAAWTVTELQGLGELEIANGGTTISTTATITHDGKLTGSGTFDKTGTGRFVLAGDGSSFAGTANIDAGSVLLTGSLGGNVVINAQGTLLVGDGTTDGDLTASTLNNGTLVFNQTGDYDYTGALSGNGGLVKQGEGTLLLSGDYGYKGSTVVEAGRVRLLSQLDSDTDLVVNDGEFDLSGTDQTVAGLSGTAGTVNIGTSTLTVNQPQNTTFGGAFTGTGTIAMLGSIPTPPSPIVINLTGFSPDFGGILDVQNIVTRINGSIGGTIVVGDSGFLGGSGQTNNIIVANAGTLTPGNSIGTLTASGNIVFEAGSTYEVELNAEGASDKLLATGRATIKGGTVSVLAAAGNYRWTNDYVILSAAGGVTGEFDDTDVNLPFLTPYLSYGANDVVLTLLRNDRSFASVAVTPNQLAVARALDASDQGASLPRAVAGQIQEAGAVRSFDALSGELWATTGTFMVDRARRVGEIVTGRMEQADVLSHALDNSGTSARKLRDGKTAIWGQGIGSWNTAKSNGNAMKATQSSFGFITGIDTLLGDWRVGVAFSHGQDKVRVDGRSSDATVTGSSLAAYAGGGWGALRARIGATYNWLDVSGTRRVVFPGVEDRLSGSYDARSASAVGEISYALSLGAATIEPFGGVNHVHLKSDGFAESGSALTALRVEETTRNVTYTTLGLRMGGAMRLSDTAVLTPRLSAAWLRGFGDTTAASRNMLSTGQAFSIDGLPTTRDTLRLEGGLQANIMPRGTLGVTYVGNIGDQWKDHGVKLGFSYSF
jgi:T5SS/PEP-CTERM-associated repeat protein/autotransporter-associated beta strand protein